MLEDFLWAMASDFYAAYDAIECANRNADSFHRDLNDIC